MARGDQIAANSVSEQMGLKLQDYAVDQLQVALCSDTFAAAALFTSLTQFTQVATGAGYAGPVSTTGTWVRSGSKSSLQAGDVSWAQNAGGPADIRIAVLFNSAVITDDVLTIVDLTADGSAPVSLVAGPLSVNFATSVTMEVDKL